MSIVSQDDFQRILDEEGIKDLLLMTNTPLLQDVAFLLQEWKPLARYLNLDEPTIVQIEEDYRDNYNEQKYQCLYKWVQLNGKDATLVSLLQTLYFRLKNKLIIHEIAHCQQSKHEY